MAEPKKRSKKQYSSYGKRHKGARELEVGMQGILITCNMNERKCTYQLYGPEKFSEEEEGGSHAEEDDDDLEAALQKEVQQLRSSTAKRQRRFQALESGANNVIFIQTQHLDPDKLVHHILQDLHSTKKKKSRVMLRMLPVSGTCRAFLEDMEKYLAGFLEPWFKSPNQGTFQIVFKARNSSHAKRDDVIKVLAALVGKLNPKNKVDLTNPEYTVIIEVIKSVCCVSVVRDYMLFRKFNLQEVVKDEHEREARSTADNGQETSQRRGGDARAAEDGGVKGPEAEEGGKEAVPQEESAAATGTE
ncbi:THUM1 protein, partial [Amia calva]|nr:THUM1 protein [Amia calva]